MEKLLNLYHLLTIDFLNILKIKFIYIFLFIFGLPGISQTFKYKVNLNSIKEDRVKVDLSVSGFNQDTLVFYFPKVVPGTYTISDYGKYVSDFNAYNSIGEQLKVRKINKNSYIIKNSRNISRISYYVDDTWDDEQKHNQIFFPMGSVFYENEVFVINSGALFGCFKKKENYPIEINYELPDNLFCFTSLKCNINGNETSCKALNYQELIDSPFMISKNDISYLKDDIKDITIACFHNKGKKMAGLISRDIETSLNAMKKFWGYFPIKEYTFLFYLTDYSNVYNRLKQSPHKSKLLKTLNVEVGALEHKHSSLYYLIDIGDNVKSPDFEYINFNGFLKEIIIHEYLHTITPIGLCDQSIRDLDMLNPEMSSHLWLYEGVIEYFANLIMVQDSLTDIGDFFNKTMRSYAQHAEKYPFKKISLDEMSKHVLEKKYNKYYNFIYTHGALTAMMLDIEIIRLSEGKQTLKDIIQVMYEKYGYKNSFKDSEFLDEFYKVAPKGISEFFDKYILGNITPDYNKYLNSIGVVYHKDRNRIVPTVLSKDNGIIDIKRKKMSYLINGEIKIVKTTPESPLKKGDVLNAFDINEKLFNGYKPEVNKCDTVYVDVLRNNEYIQVPLKVYFKNGFYKNIFEIKSDLSDKEDLYRKIWLGSTLIDN